MTDTLPRTLFWFYSLTAKQTTLDLQYSRYLFDQEMKKRNQNPAALKFFREELVRKINVTLN